MACDGYANTTVRYNLDAPLIFEVSADLAADLELIDFDGVLHQTAAVLGTTRGPASPNPPVPIGILDDCGDDDLAGRGDSRGIVLCRGVYPKPYPLLLLLIMHEMGHVLGAGHVPCDGTATMAPKPTSAKCRDRAPYTEERYSQKDLEVICRLAYGGVCAAK